MKSLKAQFIQDKDGNKVAVLLPIDDFNRLLEKIEKVDDIQLYDIAKGLDEEVIPFEQAVREIEEERDDL